MKVQETKTVMELKNCTAIIKRPVLTEEEKQRWKREISRVAERLLAKEEQAAIS